MRALAQNMANWWIHNDDTPTAGWNPYSPGLISDNVYNHHVIQGITWWHRVSRTPRSSFNVKYSSDRTPYRTLQFAAWFVIFQISSYFLWNLNLSIFRARKCIPSSAIWFYMALGQAISIWLVIVPSKPISKCDNITYTIKSQNVIAKYKLLLN